MVVDLLAAHGEHEVVAVSRRGTSPAAPRVTSAVAGYDDPAALRVALRDVDTLVFVSSDGEAVKVLIHHQNVIRAAVDAGVGHVVALSGLDADLASPFCYAVTYAYTEQLLRESGFGISVARASIYTEFFVPWLTVARRSGELRLPAADGRISFVSRGDVALCLAALAVASPSGRHHDVTGPAALDVATLAALAGQAWGTTIRFVDLEPAEYRVELAQDGEEPWWEYAYASMFASVREQRWACVSDEVSRLTGRGPTTVREVLAGA
jgi:NAD(P)H dehydrogenase (quinone)